MTIATGKRISAREAVLGVWYWKGRGNGFDVSDRK